MTLEKRHILNALRLLLVLGILAFSRAFSLKVKLGFATAAAKLATAFLGLQAPEITNEGARIALWQNDFVLISEACSGTTFYGILAASLFWIFTSEFKSYWLSIVSFFAIIFASIYFAVFANSIRICLAIFAMKLSKQFLEPQYQPIIHMLTGGICFFIFLIISVFIAKLGGLYVSKFKIAKYL